MYEDDIDYASKRLNNTLVRILGSGDPLYIESTYRDPLGVMYHIGTNLITGQRADVRHIDVDLEPVPLGFINITSGMVFVTRKPMRRDWHQGLSHTSLMTYGGFDPREIQMKWLLQPILQKYPSFPRALDSLGKKPSMAFSRDFGVRLEGKEKVLQYRNYAVGSVVNNIPHLAPNKFFLQQHLEEALA